MKKFFEFNESYLNSNYTTLYHITNDYYLLKILKGDKITRGWFENPYKDFKNGFFGQKSKNGIEF